MERETAILIALVAYLPMLLAFGFLAVQRTTRRVSISAARRSGRGSLRSPRTRARRRRLRARLVVPRFRAAIAAASCACSRARRDRHRRRGERDDAAGDVFDNVLFAWEALGPAFGAPLRLLLLGSVVAPGWALASMLAGGGLAIAFHRAPLVGRGFDDRVLRGSWPSRSRRAAAAAARTPRSACNAGGSGLFRYLRSGR